VADKLVEELSVMTMLLTIGTARIGCVTSAAAIAIAKETSVEGLKIFIAQQFVEAGLKFVEETVTTSIIIVVIIANLVG